MKKWNKISGIVFAIIIGLFIIKDPVIQMTISSVGSSVLGAPVKIGRFSLGIFTQKVDIKNLKVYNPQGFPNEPMVDIPQILVSVKPGSVLSGKLHLPNVIFNLKELVVVKNKEGQLNVDALKVTQKAVKGEKKESADKETLNAAFHIDQLKLNVERVVYKDFTKEPPVVQVFEVSLKDKTFKNIDSVEQMSALVMVNAMGPTAIQGAKVYAAATILGVGFLPAGIAGVLLGKDNATMEFKQKFEKVYNTSLDLIKKIGELKSESIDAKMIRAKVDGADVLLKFEETPDKKTRVDASARKLMVPKQELAGGVIYQISEKLK